MPISGFFYRLRVRDPDDEDNFVDCLMNAAIVMIDRKTYAQVTGLILDNGEESGRIGQEFVLENPEDDSQTLRVERLGAFFVCDKKTYSQIHALLVPNANPPPRQPDDPDGANSHICTDVVRYCQDNDPESDVWIECERIWAMVVKDAKDYAQTTLILTFWPDTLGDEIDDDTSPYPARFCEVPDDIPLDDRVTTTINTFDTFWRFDISQNPINVSWGSPVLVIAATVTGTLTFSSFTVLTPDVAEDLTRDPPLEAIVSEFAIIDNIDDPVTNQWALRPPFEVAPDPAPASPITPEMLALDAIWKPQQGFVSNGGKTKTVTTFINLGAYRKQWPINIVDEKKHVKFYIDIPENPALGEGWHIWEVTYSYMRNGPGGPFPNSGTQKFYDWPGPPSDIGETGDGYDAAADFILGLENEVIAGSIESLTTSGPSDLGRDPAHPGPFENDLTYHFEFSIWSRKDVPLNAESLPDWDFGEHTVVTYETIGAFAKRLTIEIVGGKITVTESADGAFGAVPPAAP